MYLKNIGVDLRVEVVTSTGDTLMLRMEEAIDLYRQLHGLLRAAPAKVDDDGFIVVNDSLEGLVR